MLRQPHYSHIEVRYFEVRLQNTGLQSSANVQYVNVNMKLGLFPFRPYSLALVVGRR